MRTFVDYYELLQIGENAEPETIQRVYRLLAARYHPDNQSTGDLKKFLLLKEAVETLSEPSRRTAYDLQRRLRGPESEPVSEEPRDFGVSTDLEAKRRLLLLGLLYNQRRRDGDHPCLSILALEQATSIQRDQMEFALWYLREKHFIRREDNSELAITAEGVDYVEANAAATAEATRKLLSPGDGWGVPAARSNGRADVDSRQQWSTPPDYF